MRDQMKRERGAFLAHLRLSVVALFMAVALDAVAAGNCFFLTPPTTMVFSDYSPFASGWVETPMSFSIRCTPNTTGRIVLSQGFSGTYSPRTMTNGTDTLAYNLYTDGSASVIWGDGTAGTTDFQRVFPGQGNMDFEIPVFGRIAAGMDVPIGTYVDSISVTLQADGVTKDSASFLVRTNVIGVCTVDAFTLNFGSYDPVSLHRTAPLNAATSIRAYCTKGTSATISLSNGSNWGGGTRRMSGPAGEFMSYNIFIDSARTIVWDTVTTVAATSTSKTVPLGGVGGVPGYGRVPAAQNVRPGSYRDTVVATVNY